MDTKVCKSCNVEKNIDCFHNDKRKKDGKVSTCKECKSKYDKIYRYNNKDRLKLNKLDYYEANKCIILEKCKIYRYKNKEVIKIRKSEYYYKNKDKIKEYRYNNKDRIKIYNRTRYVENIDSERNKQRIYRSSREGKISKCRRYHRRRNKELNTECTLTLEQWNKILDLQGNKCAICGRRFTSKLRPTKDHIIPLSRGGGLTFENVQALCQSCNSKKRDKLDHSKITTWGVY